MGTTNRVNVYGMFPVAGSCDGPMRGTHLLHVPVTCCCNPITRRDYGVGDVDILGVDICGGGKHPCSVEKTNENINVSPRFRVSISDD